MIDSRRTVVAREAGGARAIVIVDQVDARGAVQTRPGETVVNIRRARVAFVTANASTSKAGNGVGARGPV